MPIYDYHGFRRETANVDYLDDEKRFAKTTRVVRFGTGDICIGVAKSDGDVENEITFGPELGVADGAIHTTTFVSDPAVRLVFDRVESLDAVIERCQTLRATMLAGHAFKAAA